MESKPGQRPSAASRRRPRAARFLLESLESRALLSTTAAATEVLSPASTVELSPYRGPGGGGGITNATPPSGALTPAQISKAYNINAAATTGAGTTIAIVTAYNDPNIAADLATFSTRYGLAAASLTVVNQNGTSALPAYVDAGWSLETAMDVEWAHAAAPGAKIVLVEANSANTNDLMTAVQTAARLANVVSMSWGGSEFASQTAYDTAAYFANPNVTFLAASGDDGGASGASWPSSSPYVVAVGGTTLTLASSSGTYGGESAWSASGSWWSGYSGGGGGTSAVESVPSYQKAVVGSTSTKRVTPDVSLDANPSTGMAVYSSVSYAGQSGWFQVGGTSASTPVWAGIIAAADSARAANHLAALSTTQTLSMLYGLYGTSAYTAAFHDITSGSTYAGSARAGYDAVAGLGSPNVASIVATAATYGKTAALTRVGTTTVVTTTTTSTLRAAAAADTTSTAASTSSVTSDTTSVLVAIPASATVAQPATTSTSTTSAVSTAALAAPVASPTLPRQPLPQDGALAARISSGDDAVLPQAPEEPGGPGLFIDPVVPGDLADPGSMLARTPASTDSSQGDLTDQVLEQAWPALKETTPPAVPAVPAAPAVETGEPTPSTSTSGRALAGLTVALWGAWSVRRFRADRDSRRPFLPLPTLQEA